jgi:hypothetical protein
MLPPGAELSKANCVAGAPGLAKRRREILASPSEAGPRLGTSCDAKSYIAGFNAAAARRPED